MRLLSFSAFLTLAYTITTTAAPTAQSCDCGYTVPGDKDYYFQHAFETDFLHTSSVNLNMGWLPQNYNVTPETARGPYGKIASASQVIPNPIKSKDVWSGSGVSGADPGLQIVVSSTLDGDLIPMGEISTLANYYLYGSFRMNAKLTSVNGTCSAFFFYRNDSQEIDMEFLSSQYNSTNNMVNLINQTPESLVQGFNAAGTPGFLKYDMDFKPYEGYHEYRFDWTPDLISYYLDSKMVWNLTYSVPNSPGHIVINHWSNGDPLWSGGPPAQDATMTVSYVKAYFNSSDSVPQARFSKSCPTFENSKVCNVTALDTPADPTTDQGGQSVFLTSSASTSLKASTSLMIVTLAITFIFLA